MFAEISRSILRVLTPSFCCKSNEAATELRAVMAEAVSAEAVLAVAVAAVAASAGHSRCCAIESGGPRGVERRRKAATAESDRMNTTISSGRRRKESRHSDTE